VGEIRISWGRRGAYQEPQGPIYIAVECRGDSMQFSGLKVAFLEKHMKLYEITAREWAETRIYKERVISMPPLMIFGSFIHGNTGEVAGNPPIT
jgi:hypothetical protein